MRPGYWNFALQKCAPNTGKSIGMRGSRISFGPFRAGFWWILSYFQALAHRLPLYLKNCISLIFCLLDEIVMLFIWLRVPVPVVPINFSAVPLSLFLYITIYILVSYKYYRRDVCPSIFNWNNWNWNSFSSEPDGRSQILPLPGSPNDIFVGSQRACLLMSTFRRRNHLIIHNIATLLQISSYMVFST